MPSGIKRTREEIEEIVNNLGYILLDEYIPENGIRRVVITDSFGYKYDVTLGNLTNSHIPDFVSTANIKFSLENISIWLNLYNSEFELCKDNIYKGNKKKLKFYHSVCNEYFIQTWDSIHQGQGCSVCAGHQVGKYNNLAYKFSEIAKEWHPTKNGKLTSKDVPCGSHTKVWWLCPEGHEYCSAIAGRTRENKGCKQCADKKKESLIATELKEWCKGKFKYVDPEHKMFKNPETNCWLRCDIYLGEEDTINGVYIEVNGKQHKQFHSGYHANRQEFEDSKRRDKIMKQYARKHGLYIEIHLSKIKTLVEAIIYIENKLYFIYN